MISIGTLPFQTQSSNGSPGSCAMKLFCSNRSNSTQTYPIDLAKSEENKIVLLEKSLDFLRSQHEAMLKSLHDEIEHLRKTNKALQFRLVMCCCTNARGERGSVLRNSSTQPTGECMKEMNELKALLEEERVKNSLLLKQIEALRLTGLKISETSQNVTKETQDQRPEVVRKSERLLKEPAPNDNVQSPLPEQRSSIMRRSAHSKDKLIEFAENTKPERPSISNRSKQRPSNRIVSPELNPDSSSSAIVLSPNTMIDTPDGFWVRPSIASLQQRASIMTNSPRMSRAQGSQIMAVKLPVLRTSGSFSHISVRDTTKDALGSKVHQSNETPAVGTEDEATPARRHSNQSNEARHSRYSRSVKNMVNSYETTNRVEALPSSRSTMCYPGRTRYSNVEPFLPNLPKSAEPRHFGRQKKASDSPRKNSYDAPSYYRPP